MLFIVYKTTNRINQKYYIGKHQQETAEFDGYLGSGATLKKAIKKYGTENFRRETIATFQTESQAYDFEKQEVNPHYQLSECYNIRPGGTGRTYETTESSRLNQSLAAKRRWQTDSNILKVHQEMFEGEKGRLIRNKIQDTVTDLWQSKEYRTTQITKRNTEEYIKNRSDAAKNETKQFCEHCGKGMRASLLSRWHGARCKDNPSRLSHQ